MLLATVHVYELNSPPPPPPPKKIIIIFSSFTNLSYGRTYFNVLCDGGILQRDLEPLYIDVMTSSATPIQYTLGVEVAIPFKLRYEPSLSSFLFALYPSPKLYEFQISASLNFFFNLR